MGKERVKIEGNNNLIVKKVPYTKPTANKRTTMKFLKNGMVKIKVTKANFQHLSHIRRFRRIDKNTILDMTTGELIERKANSTGIRKKSSLHKSMYDLNELLLNNYYGEENEILVTLLYEIPFVEIINPYNDFRYFIDKLQRRIGKVGYVAVKQFTNNGYLYYEVWLKKIDSSKLNIDIDMLSSIWKYGKVMTQKIDNLMELADYVRNGQAVKNFPTDIRLYSYSTKILDKPKKYVTYYANAQKILQQENAQKVSSVTESFLNQYRIEVQRINYETYVLGGDITMNIDFSRVPPDIATSILSDTMTLLQETYSQVKYSDNDKLLINNTFKMAFNHIRNMESYNKINDKGEN